MSLWEQFGGVGLTRPAVSAFPCFPLSRFTFQRYQQLRRRSGAGSRFPRMWEQLSGNTEAWKHRTRGAPVFLETYQCYSTTLSRFCNSALSSFQIPLLPHFHVSVLLNRTSSPPCFCIPVSFSEYWSPSLVPHQGTEFASRDNGQQVQAQCRGRVDLGPAWA